MQHKIEICWFDEDRPIIKVIAGEFKDFVVWAAEYATPMDIYEGLREVFERYHEDYTGKPPCPNTKYGRTLKS